MPAPVGSPHAIIRADGRKQNISAYIVDVRQRKPTR